MSAGTVVISGGVVAAVVLLCIVTVLCFCRLQHYCCGCDVSEPVAAPVLDARPGNRSVDGVLGTLLPLTFDPSLTHSSCPTCSHFYRHDDVWCTGDVCPCVAHRAPFQGLTALGSMVMMNCSANTRAISTDV